MSEYSYEGSALLRLGEQLKNYNAAIADVIAKECPANARVLDFGAGFGTLTREVAKRITQPDCVEPDSRQREALITEGFRCYETIIRVPDASYDYVYSSNVLEHIQHDVAALCELRRVLRPTGRLTLYLPAFQSLFTSMDTAIGHYRRYDANMISARLREAGFVVQRVRYADVLGFAVSLLFKYSFNRVDRINERTMMIYDSLVFPVSQAIERLVTPPFGKNVIAVATCEARSVDVRAAV